MPRQSRQRPGSLVGEDWIGVVQEGADAFLDGCSSAVSSRRKTIAQEARKRETAQGVAGEDGSEKGLSQGQGGGDGEPPTRAGRHGARMNGQGWNLLVKGADILTDIATDHPLPQR
jgi:hypothetical protein